MRAIDSQSLVHNAAVIAFILVFGFVLIAARKANPQTAATPATPITNLR
jgi:hypothetical protein